MELQYLLNFWDIETNFNFKLDMIPQNHEHLHLEPTLYPIYTPTITSIVQIEGPLPTSRQLSLDNSLDHSDDYLFMMIPSKIKYLNIIEEKKYAVHLIFLSEYNTEVSAHFYKLTGNYVGNNEIQLFRNIDDCIHSCDRQNKNIIKELPHYTDKVYSDYIKAYQTVNKVIEREWSANT